MRDTNQAIAKVNQDIESYNNINALLPQIKKVVAKFNGKVYNCRLENALKEALPDTRLYISSQYELIEIRILSNTKNWETIASTHKANSKYRNENDWINADKRIDAEKFNENVEMLRINRLKEAASWKNFLERREEYTEQLEMLKKQIEYITDQIPYRMQDYFSIGYRVQRHY